MKKLWISAMMIGLVVSSSTLSFAQSFHPGAAAPLGYAQVKSKAAAPTELSAVEKKIYNAIDKLEPKLILKTQEFKGKDLATLIEKIAQNDRFFYYGGYSYRIYGNTTTIQFVYTESKADVLALQSSAKIPVEEKIYKALDKAEKTLVLTTQEFKGKDLAELISRTAEQSKFFYYKGWQYTMIGNKVTITFNYTNSGDIATQKKELDKAIQTIIEKNIKSGMTDYEKVKALHDYMVLNTAYDYENLNRNTVPDDSYNAYGALVKHTAVCQGYAESLDILFAEVGLKSQVITGRMTNGMDHAWNLVQLDGQYYHLDATHDDPVPDVKGQVLYHYFLNTDAMMQKSRTWKASQYPKCTASTYNYFVYNNLLAQSESDFIKRVQAAVKAKEASITVKCDGFKFSMALLDRAIGAARYYGSYRYSVDPDTNIVIISDLVY